ncbi:UPAR/Ly6 domain-containing protein crok [Oratosquilla oratoria]|uniref:UPAR/Ly6 domain-containing protein crok n=1 Tax=Oratosquilla oratoria TaxID=337810 RepID=UPI003F76D9F4
MYGIVGFILLSTFIYTGQAVKCYQCSSDENPKGKDLCGAYGAFDETLHTPVNCMDDESFTPGTFCVKRTRQSPRFFIWDGRWRTVIRRCTAVSENGVTNACNWGVDENGVYWEDCYCTSNGCNGATSVVLSSATIAWSVVVGIGLSKLVF